MAKAIPPGTGIKAAARSVLICVKAAFALVTVVVSDEVTLVTMACPLISKEF